MLRLSQWASVARTSVRIPRSRALIRAVDGPRRVCARDRHGVRSRGRASRFIHSLGQRPCGSQAESGRSLPLALLPAVEHEQE